MQLDPVPRMRQGVHACCASCSRIVHVATAEVCAAEPRDEEQERRAPVVRCAHHCLVAPRAALQRQKQCALFAYAAVFAFPHRLVGAGTSEVEARARELLTFGLASLEREIAHEGVVQISCELAAVACVRALGWATACGALGVSARAVTQSAERWLFEVTAALTVVGCRHVPARIYLAEKQEQHAAFGLLPSHI